MQDTMIAIRESDLIPQPDHDLSDTVKAYTIPNINGIIAHGGDPADDGKACKWLAVVPSGDLSSSDNTTGQYTICYRNGNDPRVFWNCSGLGGNYYPTGSYGLPLAVGL